MIKGLTLRWAMPDVTAVLRSLLGVVAVVVVALHWGPPGSATAAGAAAAIAGATALQDSPRGRLSLVVAVSLLMGLAVLVGALTSAYAALFVAAVAVWCFGAAMAWALGANSGVIAAASSALLVTAAPLPPTPRTVFIASGLAVAAGLTQAVLIAIWPQRRWRVQRDALNAAYRSLAADAQRLADGAESDGPSVHAEPLIALREAFTLTDAQAGRRPAEYRSWYGLPERIAATLAGVADRPGRSPEVDAVLNAAAGTLRAAAGASRAAQADAVAVLSRLDGAVGAVAGAESALVQRFSAQLHEAVAIRLGDFLPSTPDVVRLRRPELRVSLRSAIDVMRGHLDWQSPVLRHAVRLTVAVVAGCAIDRYAGVEHGYWIPLTVLMVLRPETAHTYTRCVGRVSGTVLGIAVASGVLQLGPGAASAAALAVLFIGIAYAVAGIGYMAVSAAVSAAVVMLVEVGGAAGAATVEDRVFATLVGAALAVIAHVALPDDALVRLQQRAGELLRTEIDYAATVIKAFVHEVDNPADALSAAWQRAFRARAAFEAAAGATRLETRDLRHWLRSLRTALNAVTASCTTLEASFPATPAAVWSRELRLAVEEYVEALCGDPPTAASPWTVRTAELTDAAQRLGDAVSRYPSADGSARVLVAEADAIARHLAAITVSSGPTSVR